MAAGINCVTNLTVEPCHGQVEHWRSGDPVVETEPVHGSCFEVGIDRLGELADHGPVLTRHGAQRENAAVCDELVRERRLFNTDAKQLGLKRHLGGPVERHGIVDVTVSAPHHVETVGKAPQHPSTQFVVGLVGIVTLTAGRVGTNGACAAWSSHDASAPCPGVIGPFEALRWP